MAHREGFIAAPRTELNTGYGTQAALIVGKTSCVFGNIR
jgi:hypothetical protein